MKLFFVLLLLLVGSLLYNGTNFYLKYKAAQKLISEAVPYRLENNGEGMSILVLGDSTAVGVGADDIRDTVPALLADKLQATEVDNQAVSGARMDDLLGQITLAKREKYDLVLVMAGANDIIRFADVKDATNSLKEVLSALPANDRLVFVLSAGNVGGTKLFPWVVRPFHTRLNLKYHEQFALVIGEYGGEYVNLYEDPKTDPFVKESGKHLAADGLHPSSSGYLIWFNKILEQTSLSASSAD